ncbi:MAG: WG repeat-containing protein [Janthinobacterium lividum]
MRHKYTYFQQRSSFWRLFCLVLASLLAHEAVAQQAPPSALKFKWIGEIIVTPPAGEPVAGHIEVGIGTFEALTPNQVELGLTRFRNNAHYFYKFLDADFAGAGGSVPMFDVSVPFPMDGADNSCPGTFHFTLLKREGVDFLYSTFEAGAEACRTTTIRAVLLQKQVAKEHVKTGDYQEYVANLLRYATALETSMPSQPRHIADGTALRSTSSTASLPLVASSPAAGPSAGHTIRLDANPVVLEVDKLYKFNDGYAVITKGSSYALINETGKIVVPFNKYEFGFNMGYPTNFEDPTYIKGMPWDQYGFIRGGCAVKDVNTGKWGILDTNLKLIIPCKYDNIHYFNEQGFITVNIHGKPGITLDRHGNVVPNTQTAIYTSEGGNYGMTGQGTYGPSHYPGAYASYGLYLVYGQRKRTSAISPPMLAGFTDRLGNMKIPARYQHAMPFYDGLAAVAKLDEFGQEKWGFINTKGEQVIDFRFSKQPGNFHHGRALVEPLQQDQYRYAYIDKKGKPIIFLRHNADCYYTPLALSMANWGGVSQAYKWPSTFSEGYALWTKSCRSSARERAEAGTLVMDTLGITFVLEQRLQRNGWPSQGFTAKSDFIAGEALLASRSGVEKAETKAIVTIQGDIVIKTPTAPGEWGDIDDLFDPASHLTKALISKNNQETIGYVNREGVMTIIQGKGSKW